jgi:hypothetical protein
MRYSDKRIEDWDFRNCVVGSPNYDVEADLFLGRRFTHVVAVNGMRTAVISALVKEGLAKIEGDGREVLLAPKADPFLAGWKSVASRFTRGGRFERRVIQALRRENQKYGRLRLTILPPLPGLASYTVPNGH